MTDLFAQLDLPSPTVDKVDKLNRYTTTPIAGSYVYRLGKDSDGAPALLIKLLPDTEINTPPIRLRHLSVSHNTDCVIHHDRGVTPDSFSVISCVDADDNVKSHFLRIVDALLPTLGSRPSAQLINQAIDHLVELFRSLQKPPVKTYQGLWAELFLISESRDPKRLVDAWRVESGELCDFNDGEHRIEVKSTRGEVRAHNFSLAQLCPPPDTTLIVASVITKSTGGGATINDLLDNLHTRISRSPDHLLRLYKIATATLGDQWSEFGQEAFDLPAARGSLAFFRASDVPMVNPEVPDGVSDVRFLSDLSSVEPCPNQEIYSLGGLMAAAILRCD